MADNDPERQRGAREGGRTLVEDAGGTRPFMRGILIHSLLSQGVGFEDAYAEIRDERVKKAKKRGKELDPEELEVNRFDLDPRDKKTVTLFADGAAGVLVQATEEPGRGWLASRLRSAGNASPPSPH